MIRGGWGGGLVCLLSYKSMIYSLYIDEIKPTHSLSNNMIITQCTSIEAKFHLSSFQCMKNINQSLVRYIDYVYKNNVCFLVYYKEQTLVS